MTLHLIRHGEIDSNVIGALDTAVPGPNWVGEQPGWRCWTGLTP